MAVVTPTSMVEEEAASSQVAVGTSSEKDEEEKVDEVCTSKLDEHEDGEVSINPVATPQRRRPTEKRGLGAIYSSMVPSTSAENRDACPLSPTQGIRELATLLRSGTAMSDVDIARPLEDPPEVRRARERAARGRSAVAKVSEQIVTGQIVPMLAGRRAQPSEQVSETAVSMEREASSPERESTADITEQVAETDAAPPTNIENSSEAGGESTMSKATPAFPKTRHRSKAAVVAEPVAVAEADQKEDEQVTEIASQTAKTNRKSSKVDQQEEEDIAEDSDVKAPKENAKSSPPKAGGGRVMKRPSSQQMSEPPVVEEEQEQGPPPSKRLKSDPEVEHFLGLGESEREKYMQNLSFTKQSKLAMRISLAECGC